MRWAATCELVDTRHELDWEGVAHPVDETAEVFCNERAVGASTWQFYHEAGVSDIAELEVRTCDYGGQRHVAYGGRRYTVEAVKAAGDNTVLTLRRQGSDTEARSDG